LFICGRTERLAEIFTTEDRPVFQTNDQKSWRPKLHDLSSGRSIGNELFEAPCKFLGSTGSAQLKSALPADEPFAQTVPAVDSQTSFQSPNLAFLNISLNYLEEVQMPRKFLTLVILLISLAGCTSMSKTTREIASENNKPAFVVNGHALSAGEMSDLTFIRHETVGSVVFVSTENRNFTVEHTGDPNHSNMGFDKRNLCKGKTDEDQKILYSTLFKISKNDKVEITWMGYGDSPCIADAKIGDF
jgi:hypothetical protein